MMVKNTSGTKYGSIAHLHIAHYWKFGVANNTVCVQFIWEIKEATWLKYEYKIMETYVRNDEAVLPKNWHRW